jgi:hypothetical protein
LPGLSGLNAANTPPTNNAVANAYASLLGNAGDRSAGTRAYEGLAAAQRSGGLYSAQQVELFMRASQDPNVRAAANNPALVAQYAAVINNPQQAAALARAQQAGVNTAGMQGAWAALAGVQQGQIAAAQVAPQITPIANSVANPAAAPAANALGGLFGALTGQAGSLAGNAGVVNQALPAVATTPAAAAPAAPAALPAPTAAAPSNLAAQAQARKEHLTRLFLGKGCKLSDIQR